ncbi:hypothetical protein CsatB_020274 [Cannabis sativa]
MVQELAEPGTIAIRDSESTVSTHEHLVHSRHAPDAEVKEISEDWEAPDREVDEEEDAEGSGTDSVDNPQMNEPFSCEDLPNHLYEIKLVATCLPASSFYPGTTSFFY